jgi:hypothetical protein
METLPLIAGAVLLLAGTAFAITIGTVSNRDDSTREHQAGH